MNKVLKNDISFIKKFFFLKKDKKGCCFFTSDWRCCIRNKDGIQCSLHVLFFNYDNRRGNFLSSVKTTA